MRFLLFVALGAVMAACTPTQPTRTTAGYDPSLIVYNPRPAELDGCGGLVIGRDPDWAFEESFEPGGPNGRPRVVYRHELTAAISERLNPSPLAQSSVNVTVDVVVSCDAVPSADGEAERIADRFSEIIAKRPMNSDVRRKTLSSGGGTWEGVDYRSTGETGTVFSVRRMWQQRDGRLVTIFLVVQERDNLDAVRTIPAGEEYRLEKPDGSFAADVLAKDTQVSERGALLGRPEPEDIAAFHRAFLSALADAG